MAAFERLERLLPGLYFCWAVLFGAVLVWVVPPWQNPDERAHVARAVQIALGQLVGRRLGPLEAGGTTDPAIDRSEAPMVGLRFNQAAKDTAALEQATGAVRWGNPGILLFPNTALYPPLFYLPMVPAVWIGRAGRMHVVATLRLMRLFGLFAAAGLGAGAIAAARRTRPVLLAILVLPMSLSLAASPSQDGLMIPTACLAAGLLDRARSFREVRMGAGLLAVLAVSTLAVTLARPSNLPLGLTLLLLPASQRRTAVLLTACVITASLAWTLYGVARISVPMFQADPGAQEAILLRHPGLFVTALLATLHDSWDSYVTSMIGVLNWLDTMLPEPFYRAAEVVLAASLFCAAAPEPGRRWRSRWLALACALGAAVLTFLALYVGWTAPRADRVLGFQGRYMLPLVPAFALGLPNLGRWTEWLRPPALAAVLLLAATTPAAVLTTLVERYYLG